MGFLNKILKGVKPFGGVIESGADVAKTAITVRARWIRFAKICVIALAVFFAGISLLLAVKADNIEVIDKLIEFIMQLLSSEL